MTNFCYVTNVIVSIISLLFIITTIYLVAKIYQITKRRKRKTNKQTNKKHLCLISKIFVCYRSSTLQKQKPSLLREVLMHLSHLNCESVQKETACGFSCGYILKKYRQCNIALLSVKAKKTKAFCVWCYRTVVTKKY